MNPYGDWETAEFIQRRLVAENVAATPDQWARWRRWGFLPPVRQSGAGQGAGSLILYPPGTADRTIKVATLFAIKEKATWVGWRLWWEGEDVPESWWRPTIEKAARSWRRALGFIVRATAKADRDDADGTIFDEIPASIRSELPFNLALRGIADSELPEFFGTMVDVALGQWAEPVRNERERDGVELLATGLGFYRAKTDSIMGHKLDIMAALPGALRSMARMPELPETARLFSASHLPRLIAARDDVRNALATASAFRQASCWIYGRNAFGLRLAGWFSDHAPPALLAAIVLGFMQLRLASNELMSSGEIARLRQGAELARDRSLAFQLAMKTHPNGATLLDPKRVRSALENQTNLEIYRQEIRTGWAN